MTSPGSMYFDLMCSNERTASVSIRPLPTGPDSSEQWWAYEVMVSPAPSQRGAVACNHDSPLRVVSAVLDHWRKAQ